MSTPNINYLVRPNKNIERKLIFDRLLSLSSICHFSRHRYLGLGSFWFVDFLLAHRALGINELVSMELSADAERAIFNKPLACITVVAGSSHELLPGFSDDRWNAPYLVWMDYTGILNDDVMKDVDLLIRKLTPPSFLIITLNSYRNNYRSGPQSARVSAKTNVEQLIGASSLASGFNESNGEIDLENFSAFLSRSILNMMVRKTRLSGRYSAGSPVEFLPLFDFFHKDGAEMITLGGAIVEGTMRPTMEALAGVAGGTLQHVVLDLPQLTVREKAAMDRLLPEDEDVFVRRAEQAGIVLSADEIRKYQRYYKHFPIFAEAFV